MSKTLSVFKYRLPQSGYAIVEMPTGATILSVADQDDELMLWASVVEDAPKVKRDFLVAMTGEPLNFINCVPVFIGTVLLDDGAFVVHVFEVTKHA